MNSVDQDKKPAPALQKLLGQRIGPYNSFNPVSRVQIWQWCSAMGDRSPLYLNEQYQAQTEFCGLGAVAPPAMMQMWTMRDINDEYAPGSTDTHPYRIMQDLEKRGFPANVAVSYDIQFHRYLLEGDRVHHYKSVVELSDLKTTALGEGYFFTDRMEYLDQNDELFAEALISYFQYRPASAGAGAATTRKAKTVTTQADPWQSDHQDISVAQLALNDVLPELLLPITHKQIVAGAIASQDFVAVHHNQPAAQAAAMPDIFMNILTTSGLCARYLGDWAGPGSRLRQLKLQLMAPNTPGDTMTMQGSISALDLQAATVSVNFAGINSLGPHVRGSATLLLV